jgi:hypothetical protein
MYQRFFAIVLNLMGISSLIVIVRDELGEIFRHQGNTQIPVVPVKPIIVSSSKISIISPTMKNSINPSLNVSDSSKNFDFSSKSLQTTLNKNFNLPPKA